jgi:hypothetical protein
MEPITIIGAMGAAVEMTERDKAALALIAPFGNRTSAMRQVAPGLDIREIAQACRADELPQCNCVAELL